MSELPQVISEDSEAILAATVAKYEAISNKTLYPAQIERLLINIIAYRETLICASMNDAARQNLPQFARSPMLEYHGARVNTFRLPPQAARTTLRFSRASSLSVQTLIARGTRVQSATGAVFATLYDVVIAPGVLLGTVEALCDTTGTAANGLVAGQIKDPFDALPTGVSVVNLTTSAGGAELEDFERFRSRVLLAYARPSAGAAPAYRYTALSADSRVIDVSVWVVSPGWVRLAILTDGDPEEIVAAVNKAVQADDVKPLTDRADVVAATGVAAPITITLTPRKGTVLSELQQRVASALEALRIKLSRTLGYDEVGSQVVTLLQNLGGFKDVVVPQNVAIAPNQFAQLSWTLNWQEAADD